MSGVHIDTNRVSQQQQQGHENGGFVDQYGGRDNRDNISRQILSMELNRQVQRNRKEHKDGYLIQTSNGGSTDYGHYGQNMERESQYQSPNQGKYSQDQNSDIMTLMQEAHRTKETNHHPVGSGAQNYQYLDSNTSIFFPITQKGSDRIPNKCAHIKNYNPGPNPTKPHKNFHPKPRSPRTDSTLQISHKKSIENTYSKNKKFIIPEDSPHTPPDLKHRPPQTPLPPSTPSYQMPQSDIQCFQNPGSRIQTFTYRSIEDSSYQSVQNGKIFWEWAFVFFG